MIYESLDLTRISAYDLLTKGRDLSWNEVSESEVQEYLIRTHTIADMVEHLLRSRDDSILCQIRKALIAFGGTLENLMSVKTLEDAINALDHTLCGLEAAMRASG